MRSSFTALLPWRRQGIPVAVALVADGQGAGLAGPIRTPRRRAVAVLRGVLIGAVALVALVVVLSFAAAAFIPDRSFGGY